MTLLSTRFRWLENKSHLHISFKLCLCIFHLASLGRESQVFGQQQFKLGYCQWSFPENKGAWVPVNSVFFLDLSPDLGLSGHVFSGCLADKEPPCCF